MICPSTSKVWCPETNFAVGWPTSAMIGNKAVSVATAGATLACLAAGVVAEPEGLLVVLALPQAVNQKKSSRPMSMVKDV